MHRRPGTPFSAGLSAGLALTLTLTACAGLRAQPASTGSGPVIDMGGAFGGNVDNAPTNPIGPDRALPGRMPSLPSSAGAGVPLGPGANVTFPDQPQVFDSSLNLLESEPGQGNLTIVKPAHLKYAQSIPVPGDRALTLQRLANAAIFSNQLDLAHQALIEAGQAALQVKPGMEHDQRLIAIIMSLINLAESDLREGKVDLSLPDVNEKPPAEPLPPVDRVKLIDRALDEWRRAEALAEQITNVTYRVEMMFRVADNASYGSQTIVNEFPHEDESLHDAANRDRRADATTRSRADAILVEASDWAQRIERPVFRDRSLVTITAAAAASNQFARGLQVARLIPQPEVRTDALVRLAESQARRNDPDGATKTYAEAARAVASIPLNDPRVVLAGVLIDNLTSVGRFEDARRSITLYPDRSHQLAALGAIAESMGRRGRADSAREWIERLPSEERPALYRRVITGVIAAIESNRSRDLSNRTQ